MCDLMICRYKETTVTISNCNTMLFTDIISTTIQILNLIEVAIN